MIPLSASLVIRDSIGDIVRSGFHFVLTHWGRVTHICVSELTIIGSDNGLSPGRRQAIIWNNAGLLLIEPLGTSVNEISIEIQTFSFKKTHLKTSSAKWRPCCLGLNVLSLIQSHCSGLVAFFQKNQTLCYKIGRSWLHVHKTALSRYGLN